MSDRRLSTTLKNLALALLNATLILVALCLFLAWQVFQSFEGISDRFADRLTDLAPLRGDIQALTTEATGLRADLQALRSASATGAETITPAVQARITALEAKVAETSDRVNALLDAPETLVFGVIDHGAASMTQSLTEIIGCTRPEA